MIKQPDSEEKRLRRSIRYYILFFIFAIVISGISTFPIETELAWMNAHLDAFPAIFRDWLAEVYAAVKSVNAQYPFLSYGTDWLAFAHLIIAIAFIGPLKDPVKNIWVIQWGMICCLCVFPLAFIAGPIRHIPIYWILVDCSFGVVGIILLFLCYRKIKRLQHILNLDRQK
jgi:energy-converting hydrogenase Eha subunit E